MIMHSVNSMVQEPGKARKSGGLFQKSFDHGNSEGQFNHSVYCMSIKDYNQLHPISNLLLINGTCVYFLIFSFCISKMKVLNMRG